MQATPSDVGPKPFLPSISRSPTKKSLSPTRRGPKRGTAKPVVDAKAAASLTTSTTLDDEDAGPSADVTALQSQHDSMLRELRQHVTKEAYMGPGVSMLSQTSSYRLGGTARPGTSVAASGTMQFSSSAPDLGVRLGKLAPMAAVPAPVVISREQCLHRLRAVCVGKDPLAFTASSSLALALESTPRLPTSTPGMCARAVWEVSAMFPSACVYVGLLGDRGNSLSYVAASPNSGMKGVVAPRAPTASWTALDTAKTQVIMSVSEGVSTGRLMPLSHGAVGSKTASLLTSPSKTKRSNNTQQDGPRAFVCVPLCVGARCVGVLSLDGPVSTFTTPWCATTMMGHSVSGADAAKARGGKLGPVKGRKKAWSDSESEDDAPTEPDAANLAFLSEAAAVVGRGVDIRRKTAALVCVRDSTLAARAGVDAVCTRALEAIRANVLHAVGECVWSPTGGEGGGDAGGPSELLNVAKAFAAASPTRSPSSKRRRSKRAASASQRVRAGDVTVTVFKTSSAAHLQLDGHVGPGVDARDAVALAQSQLLGFNISPDADGFSTSVSVFGAGPVDASACTLKGAGVVQIVTAVPYTQGPTRLALSVVLPARPGVLAGLADDITFCKDVCVEMGVSLARLSEAYGAEAASRAAALERVTLKVQGAHIHSDSDLGALTEGVADEVAGIVSGDGVRVCLYALGGAGNVLTPVGHAGEGSLAPAPVDRWTSSALFVCVDDGVAVTGFHDHTTPSIAGAPALPSFVVKDDFACPPECAGVWAAAFPLPAAVGDSGAVGVMLVSRHHGSDHAQEGLSPDVVSFCKAVAAIFGPCLRARSLAAAGAILETRPAFDQSNLRVINDLMKQCFECLSAGGVRSQTHALVGTLKGLLVEPDRDPDRLHAPVSANSPTRRSGSRSPSPKSRKKAPPAAEQHLHGASPTTVGLGEAVDADVCAFLAGAAAGDTRVFVAEASAPVFGCAFVACPVVIVSCLGPAPNPFHAIRLGIATQIVTYWHPPVTPTPAGLSRAMMVGQGDAPLSSRVAAFVAGCFADMVAGEKRAEAALALSLNQIRDAIAAVDPEPLDADYAAVAAAAQARLKAVVYAALPRCRLFIGMLKDSGECVEFAASSSPIPSPVARYPDIPVVGSRVFRTPGFALFHCVDAPATVPAIVQADGSWECETGSVLAHNPRGGCDIVFAPMTAGAVVVGVLCAERSVYDCSKIASPHANPPKGRFALITTEPVLAYDPNFTEEEDAYISRVAALFGEFVSSHRHHAALSSIRAVSSLKRPLALDVFEALLAGVASSCVLAVGEAVLQLVQGKCVVAAWSRQEVSGEEVGVAGPLRAAALELSNCDWQAAGGSAVCAPLDNGCGVASAPGGTVVMGSVDSGDYSLKVTFVDAWEGVSTRTHDARVQQEVNAASELFLECINTLAVLKGKRLERTYQLKAALESVKAFCLSSFVSLFKMQRLRRAVRVEKEIMASESSAASSDATSLSGDSAPASARRSSVLGSARDSGAAREMPMGEAADSEGGEPPAFVLELATLASARALAPLNLSHAATVAGAGQAPPQADHVAHAAAVALEIGAADAAAVYGDAAAALHASPPRVNAAPLAPSPAPAARAGIRRACEEVLADALSSAVDAASVVPYARATAIVAEAAIEVTETVVQQADAAVAKASHPDAIPSHIVQEAAAKEKARQAKRDAEAAAKAEAERAKAAKLASSSSSLSSRMAVSADTKKAIASVCKCIIDVLPSVVVRVGLMQPGAASLRLTKSTGPHPSCLPDSVSIAAGGADPVSMCMRTNAPISGFMYGDGAWGDCATEGVTGLGTPGPFGVWLVIAPLSTGEERGANRGVLIVESPVERAAPRAKFEAEFTPEDIDFFTSSASMLGTAVIKSAKAACGKAIDAAVADVNALSNASVIAPPARRAEAVTGLYESVALALTAFVPQAVGVALARDDGVAGAPNLLAVAGALSPASVAKAVAEDARVSMKPDGAACAVFVGREFVAWVGSIAVNVQPESTVQASAFCLHALPAASLRPANLLIVLFPLEHEQAARDDTHAAQLGAAAAAIALGARAAVASEHHWASFVLSARDVIATLCDIDHSMNHAAEVVSAVANACTEALEPSGALCRVAILQGDGAALTFVDGGHDGYTSLRSVIHRDDDTLGLFACVNVAAGVHVWVDGKLHTPVPAVGAVPSGVGAWLAALPLISYGAAGHTNETRDGVRQGRVVGIVCVERQGHAHPLHACELALVENVAVNLGTAVDTLRHRVGLAGCASILALEYPHLLSACGAVLPAVMKLLQHAEFCGFSLCPPSGPPGHGENAVTWLHNMHKRAAPHHLTALPAEVTDAIRDLSALTHPPEHALAVATSTGQYLVYALNGAHCWAGPIAFVASGPAITSSQALSLQPFLHSDAVAVAASLAPLNALLESTAASTVNTVCAQAMTFIQRRLKLRSCFYGVVDADGGLRFAGGTHVRVHGMHRVVTRAEYPEMFTCIDSGRVEVLPEVPWEASSPFRRESSMGMESPLIFSTSRLSVLTSAAKPAPQSPSKLSRTAAVAPHSPSSPTASPHARVAPSSPPLPEAATTPAGDAHSHIAVAPLVGPSGSVVAILGADMFDYARPGARTFSAKCVRLLSHVAELASVAISKDVAAAEPDTFFGVVDCVARAAVAAHAAQVSDIAAMPHPPQAVRALCACALRLLGYSDEVAGTWQRVRAELLSPTGLLHKLSNFVFEATPPDVVPLVAKTLAGRDVAPATFSSHSLLAALFEWCVTVVLWAEDNE